MSKFVFIDLFTQKGFVENFGSCAIPHCPEIRENLMDLTSMASKHEIPILSFMYSGFTGDDFDKVSDTESDKVGSLQQLISVDSLEDFSAGSATQVLVEQFLSATAFVYGVPAETAVKSFCETYLSKFAKLWIVEDAIKGFTDSVEKIPGVKYISTRNLEKFIQI